MTSIEWILLYNCNMLIVIIGTIMLLILLIFIGVSERCAFTRFLTSYIISSSYIFNKNLAIPRRASTQFIHYIRYESLLYRIWDYYLNHGSTAKFWNIFFASSVSFNGSCFYCLSFCTTSTCNFKKVYAPDFVFIK